MAILIFRRPMNGHLPLPYAEWLADLGEPIVLFTTGHDGDEESYAHVERFDSFDADGLTEIRALELAKSFAFTRVFAQSEHDLIRAAELREWLALPGQSLKSAITFRDKLLMKNRARTAGVATPDFAPLHRPLDLYRFAADHGYPCVVKPRWGAGSRGVRVLRSEGDLKHFLQQPLPAHYMVESFDDAPLYHVDGLATDNELFFVSVSRYVGTCLSFQRGESSGGVLLNPAEALSKRLVDVTAALLCGLPWTRHLAIHAELFADESGEARLCEIAARPGGSRTTDPIDLVYGLNVYQQWVRLSFELPVALPPARPWSAAGYLRIPPRCGVLRYAPESIPFEWVADYRMNYRTGDRCDEPTFSGANVASFIVTGADTEEVESRVRILDAWFREQLQWDERAFSASA